MGEAAGVILTPEEWTTEAGWEAETPHLCDLLERRCPLDEQSWVLDHGCGIGRLAKELIKRHNCRGMGTDISEGTVKIHVHHIYAEPGLSNRVELAVCARERGIIGAQARRATVGVAARCGRWRGL